VRDEGETALRRTLDALVDGGPAPGLGADAWELALAAFAASWRLEHGEAAESARRAAAALPAEPRDDPATTVLVRAMLALAAAGTGIRGGWRDTAPGSTPSGDPLEDALPLLPLLDDSDGARFARYALGEAALACARVGLSATLGSGPATFSGPLAGHSFETIMAVLAARVAAFSGRIDEAGAVLDRAAPTDSPRLGDLMAATRSLVAGNAAEPAAVRAMAARVGRIDPERDDRIESGIALLTAYGLIAIDDVRRVAALVAGFNWDRAMVIDRALTLEMLVHAAIREDDQGAAEAWLARVEAFAGDPIADSTVARARSRVLLFEGDADAAVEAAETAIRLADAAGRGIEAGEGEILAARARIVAGRRGDAARRLETVVAGVGEDYRGLLRAAARELRGTGRRLRPPAGSGATALSAREQQVLELLLDGRENAEIAEALHISVNTARIHVSRILAAYGAPTRLALATGMLAESGAAPSRVDPADVDAAGELTPRQRMVVAEAITGAGNVEIARRLGIAVRTVEKHLTEAMRRSGVTTRVGLVMHVAGRPSAADAE